MRTLGKTFTGLLLCAVALSSTMALADRDRGRGWGNRKHDHDHSNVSVNVNVVPRPYYRDYSYRDYPRYNTWSYGVGFGSYGTQFYVNSWSNPYSRWDYYDRRPVIVEKNIYIEHSTPANPVTTRSISRSTTSLFRDRYGRCYEREVDSFGNETRIEIDPSQCNF